MELKKYRRVAGLTQQQLADRSGVDISIISRMERGHTGGSYENVVRLAHALNLEPEELCPVDLTVPKPRSEPAAAE